jgi:protein CWC15
LGFCRQSGQTSTDDVKKRDLRAELLAAEAEARNKKRKAEGKPLLEEDVRKAAAIEAPKDGTPATEDDEANKRRKLLQEALEMDKDDEEDEEEEKNDEDGDERYVPEIIRPPLGF